MKFRHIIWDWNGTLVDDTWLFVDIMNGVLKNRNLPIITLEDYRNVFDFPVKDYYLKLGFDFSDEPFESSGLDFIKIYDSRKFEPELFEDTQSTLDVLGKKDVHIQSCQLRIPLHYISQLNIIIFITYSITSVD